MLGRDRSRGAGRGCGTAARTERIRTLSGVRERLEDEGRSGGDGGTAGAGERQGPGAVGAKAEATGAGQKDAGRDRSRGAEQGSGTAARIERIRTLSGVRERLEDEGRSGEDGRTDGAAETGAGGAKAEATGAGQKDAGTGPFPGCRVGMRNGSTHSTDPNFVRRAGEAGRRGQKRRGRRNGRSCGSGSRRGEATGAGQKDAGRDRSRGAGRGCGTVVRIERIRTLSGVRERLGDEGRSGEDGRTVGAGERRKREPEGRRLDRKMPGRGRRGQKKAGRNREQGFGWPVRKLIFDGGSIHAPHPARAGIGSACRGRSPGKNRTERCGARPQEVRVRAGGISSISRIARDAVDGGRPK